MYKIEKNIPLPAETDGSFPLNHMKIGDSFFVECKDDKAKDVRAKLWTQIKRQGIKKKFTTRKIKGGIRIWRIS